MRKKTVDKDDKTEMISDDVKQPFFIGNNIVGSNRTEPLIVFDFLKDLREVFEKHQVNLIRDGVIGFNNVGGFGIVNSYMDIQPKNLKF